MNKTVLDALTSCGNIHDLIAEAHERDLQYLDMLSNPYRHEKAYTTEKVVYGLSFLESEAYDEY